MKTIIDGMEVEGTPEEILSLIRMNIQKTVPPETLDIKKINRTEDKIIESVPLSHNKTSSEDDEEAPFPGVFYQGKKWSLGEMNLVKRYYRKYMNEYKISPKGLDILERLLKHRSRKAIQDQARELGLTSGMFEKTNHPINKDSKFLSKAKYMLRDKPLPIEDPMKGKTAIVVEDNPFPKIFPLADGAELKFKELLVHMLQTKRPITPADVNAVLQLKTGYVWDGRTWGTFCEQVMYNTASIARSLGVSTRDIKVKFEGGRHKIFAG
jgi:hypothetical protein